VLSGCEVDSEAADGISKSLFVRTAAVRTMGFRVMLESHHPIGLYHSVI
jgi:hypothetical protein